MSREVTWDGKKYPSIAAASRAADVPYSTFREWIDLPKNHTHRKAPITIRGITYPNMKAAAKRLRVSTQTIHQAREKGTLDAVGIKKNGGSK